MIILYIFIHFFPLFDDRIFTFRRQTITNYKDTSNLLQSFHVIIVTYYLKRRSEKQRRVYREHVDDIHSNGSIIIFHGCKYLILIKRVSFDAGRKYRL